MPNKALTLLLFLLVFTRGFAQVDSTDVYTNEALIDTIATDSIEMVGDNIITNSSALSLFFEKLYLMEQQKAGKINIVHIGDSHIQADLMTNCIRKRLQEMYGNAGAGFIFPHQLAKTNGTYNVRFKSNASWAARRNIFTVEEGMPVGLSGIGLKTRENFAVELDVKDSAYRFNTIKIITPKNASLFDVATSSKTIVLESTVPKKIIHRIKSGEVLGSIANKYGITITQLKQANGLKNNNIRAGKTLKIPTNELQKKEVKRSEFIPLSLEADALSHFYHSENALDKIYLLPNKEEKEVNLSGLVLENDAPGILYHSIGVNGAKASDYNKYPLFFEQLPALVPDLVIVSLGTNESFDKMASPDFMVQLNQFLANVKAKNPDACILVMTPPPSLFRRKYPNTFAASYAKSIVMQETDLNYASWDLYTEMGGLYGVNRNAARGLMAGDKVHYSKDGYEKQGKLFAESFIKAYDNFKTNRK
ncbi:LysM peptidoglycan-binding domain-containing protein [Flavobacterium zepuense]|uniref:LysM peptidoglycan-binding domain-containing protein n=1 Tax=Flavobacterium zepuense TaxID=2593302 RepID=A0A552V2K1_9FLAO|nr:LysM peptidoglycan-binding domain-containing protein [Flavobacterium zepuense]TRW24694.1 LysM peptidoglycan-binding domain-containing protein [Flavobacterium zepuense]